MQIKNLILVSMIIILCSHKLSKNTADIIPSSAANTPTPRPAKNIPYIIAKNYFVNNDYKKEEHPNAKITSLAEFEKIFGMARVMGGKGKPTAIDFSKQYVISIIEEPTDRNIEIVPLSLKQKKGTIVFNYKRTVGKQRSVTIQPALIIIVDKKYNGQVKVIRS